MKQIHTHLQKMNTDLPTQLDFLQVLSRRGSAYFKEEKQLYKSLQAGDEGERKLLQYLFAFGPSHWRGVRNLWLKDFKSFECDLLLITKHCIYILEVKNYRGVFSYNQGQCYFNGNETPLNPFEQVRANAVSVRNYLKRLNINIPVKAAIAFTGVDNEVFIQSQLNDIEVIQSNGIRNFIETLVLEEKKSIHHSRTPEFIIGKLEQIEITNPFMPAPLTEHALREMKSGMYCTNCMSFDYKRSQQKIHCECGKEEKIERAVLRAISDYSILHYNQLISRIELMEFFNGEIGLSLLRKILTRYFDKTNDKGPAYYKIDRGKLENLLSQ